MTILDCNVANCMYNADRKCSKYNILVDGSEASMPHETCCSSFQEQGSARNAVSQPKTELDVQCKAVNCTFNDNRHCHADHIGINGVNACVVAETECASFRCKQ
ncbi:DUF1540 domain-containing protein [Lachnospiraceae bacterium 47-T17]